MTDEELGYLWVMVLTFRNAHPKPRLPGATDALTAMLGVLRRHGGWDSPEPTPPTGGLAGNTPAPSSPR